MLTLDGSHGEGGGQILRTGLALSMVTGRPLRIDRIRAGRPKPGLMRQHLACVQAAVQVCGGQAEGAELGSQALQFTPGPVQAGDYAFAIAGAGSCLLVLQTVLPALMLAGAPSRVQLSGGTHNPMAPPFDFLQRAFAPLVRRLGVGLDLTLRRRGFYPAGGGEVHAVIAPASGPLAPFDLLDRGARRSAWAEALVPGLARGIAVRELAALRQQLDWSEGDDPWRIPPARQNEGPGNALLAVLEHAEVTEVFCALGERGMPAEQVARQLAGEVRSFEHSRGAVGPHLADQWMLPLALAVWRSGQQASYTAEAITPHASTNAQVIAQCLPVRIAMAPCAGATRIDIEKAASPA
ncbi:RNA 3'-terminal phosphate cyclase [Acidovorax sp. SUPP1855]|uniref:RNA 3'-terminal phosphate cyclase n=1 Tax=Acidovorax sp. SUPP1855 TaxID=431774 RepID=UPI0023DE653D|nr:RNA 3'-terminal phosphate cyclase [Acidovorax sp. SUPP1855]GKS84207.1 RNA 3'-terminal phosphate cyclase [Acidovorax sp. SUPP1855]